MSGTLFVISAPSGAGKTSLIHSLLKTTDNILMSVSHTTREQRLNEKDGTDYHFVDRDTFEKLIADNCFLEHAHVFKHYYGTSKQWVEQQLAAGIDVILEIDWQGAAQVRQQMPDSVGIYILPPSLQTLRQRLSNRQQDDQETINYRMSEAQKEMSHYHEYDYLLINDQFDSTLGQMKSIMVAHRLQMAAQRKKHQALIYELLIDHRV